MPKSESQKRASKKYYDKNKEVISDKAKAKYRQMKAALIALQARVDEFCEANDMEPMDCSKLPGAPEL